MPKTFTVECPVCEARVGVAQEGFVERGAYPDSEGEPVYGERVYTGKCPECRTLLVGHSQQIAVEGWDSHENEWGAAKRVYPSPPRSVAPTAPKVVRNALGEAEVCMQVGSLTAACVMFGRAIEAMCRDRLKTTGKLTLGKGLAKLREAGIIDDKLAQWGSQLNAFRNAAAHPDEDMEFPRQDVEDLKAFAFAIIEYVYDLSARYDEFLARTEAAKKAAAAKALPGKPPAEPVPF